MVDRVAFPADVTGAEAPTTPEPILSGTEKALADTKAELTRVQQELAALKKTPADTPAAPPEGQAAETPAEPKPDGEPQASPGETPEQKAAADAVKAAGLDVSPWQAEFASTGDVSEEGRAKIAEGLKALFGEDARSVVDQFIDGRKATQAQETAVYYEAAGGADNYSRIAEWAKTNMTPSELTAYNTILQTGDKDAALVAIKGLRARYEAVNGREPRLLAGDAAASGRTEGYRSKAEMVREMSDPRYATDPAYRKTVEDKIMRSQF